MYTYTEGPSLKIQYDFLNEHLTQLCSDLSRRLKTRIILDSEADAFTLRFYSYNKTIRLWSTTDIISQRTNWPYLVWRDPKAIIWRNENYVLINTFLTAFRGAPCWTVSELTILMDCLRRNGAVQKYEFYEYSLAIHGKSGYEIDN